MNNLLQIHTDTTFSSPISLGSIAILPIVVSLVLGILVTLFLIPLIQGTVDNFMVDVFGTFKVRKKRKLAGEWNQRWFHSSSHYPLPCESKGVKIKQFRDTIKATYSVVDIRKRERTYRVIAKINTDYVTGIWEDVDKGSTYHGCFQLKILPNAHFMTGHWVGWSSEKGMQSGLWEWKRINEGYYPEEEQK